jgi:hypothetical protein
MMVFQTVELFFWAQLLPSALLRGAAVTACCQHMLLLQDCCIPWDQLCNLRRRMSLHSFKLQPSQLTQLVTCRPTVVSQVRAPEL